MQPNPPQPRHINKRTTTGACTPGLKKTPRPLGHRASLYALDVTVLNTNTPTIQQQGELGLQRGASKVKAYSKKTTLVRGKGGPNQGKPPPNKGTAASGV